MGIVRACHDVSEGGIGLAAAEMAIASPRRGIKMDLKRVPSQTKRSDSIIFSESTGRFLVEADAGRAEEFERIFYGLPGARIGEVVDGSRLAFMDMGGREYSIDSKRLRLAWRGY
jgi:phosphoribosylformylglycinamidine synthase